MSALALSLGAQHLVAAPSFIENKMYSAHELGDHIAECTYCLNEAEETGCNLYICTFCHHLQNVALQVKQLPVKILSTSNASTFHGCMKDQTHQLQAWCFVVSTLLES